MNKYTIKGIKMTPSEYQRLRFVVTNEEQQGWKPTKSDINTLVNDDRHPNKTEIKDMKKYDKDMKKAGRK